MYGSFFRGNQRLFCSTLRIHLPLLWKHQNPPFMNSRRFQGLKTGGNLTPQNPTFEGFLGHTRNSPGRLGMIPRLPGFQGTKWLVDWSTSWEKNKALPTKRIKKDHPSLAGGGPPPTLKIIKTIILRGLIHQKKHIAKVKGVKIINLN